MLCSLPAGKQHSGTFPNPVVERNRCIHQMVERKTCSKGDGTPGPLVPHSQPSESTEAVSTKVAPSSSGLPSSVPHAIFQDGLHQTCSCSRPTLQSQTGHRRLVDHPTGNMLLQKLGTFQSCCTQSIRPPLGLSRFPASSLHLRGLGGHCGRLLTQQSLPSRKNTAISSNLGFKVGKNATAYLLCQPPRSRICANISGQNTPNKSHVTSPSHPSTHFNKPLRGLSSIAKINKPHPCESFARACATKPLKRRFRIPRS